MSKMSRVSPRGHEYTPGELNNAEITNVPFQAFFALGSITDILLDAKSKSYVRNDKVYPFAYKTRTGLPQTLILGPE